MNKYSRVNNDAFANMTEAELQTAREMEEALFAAFNEAMLDPEFRKNANCLAKNERRSRRDFSWNNNAKSNKKSHSKKSKKMYCFCEE